MAQTSQEESEDDASSTEAVILLRQDKKFAPFNVLFFFVIRNKLLYPNNSKEQEIS